MMAGLSRIFGMGSAALAALALGGAAYSIGKNTPIRGVESPPFPPTSRPVEGRVAGYVGAVGVVEPASELIEIGTQLAGVVVQVAVKAGDRVEAGGVLFRLDDRSARADLDARGQDLAVAEARLCELRASVAPTAARVESAGASVRQAKADLEELRDQFRRSTALAARGAATAEELTQRKYAAEAGAARVAEAEARLHEARGNLALLEGPDGGPTVAVQRATVARARSAVVQAETMLDLLTVRSPISATVLQVRVRLGEFAQAAILSAPMMILGVIDPLHVRADIDESEVGRFLPTARAYASLRGLADRRADLRFVRVEPLIIPKKTLTGITSERVDTRVLQVIYELDPGALPARPGQQVDLYIDAAPSMDVAPGR
jgi:HlyD family secretion protein